MFSNVPVEKISKKFFKKSSMRSAKEENVACQARFHGSTSAHEAHHVPVAEFGGLGAQFLGRDSKYVITRADCHQVTGSLDLMPYRSGHSVGHRSID